jgi:hypothetical protein
VNRSPQSIAILQALRARVADVPEASGIFAVSELVPSTSPPVYQDDSVPPTLRSNGSGAWLTGPEAYYALTARVTT